MVVVVKSKHEPSRLGFEEAKKRGLSGGDGGGEQHALAGDHQASSGQHSLLVPARVPMGKCAK